MYKINKTMYKELFTSNYNILREIHNNDNNNY